MRKLRIGKVIEQFDGTPVTRAVLSDDGQPKTAPYTVRDALVVLLQNHEEKELRNGRILRDIGKAVATFEGEWYEMENADYTFLKDAVYKQAGVLFKILVSVPLREAFEESDDLWQKREGKEKKK